MHLWLIRHAKSDWNQPGQPDFERSLNKRGLRDGPLMRDWLQTTDHRPAWIWCSDAKRTQMTAEFVCAAFPDAQLSLDHRLYHAGPETILNLIHETPPDIDSVAVIAHNPGLTQICNLLCGRSEIDNLPTFGVAQFTLDGTPADLRFGNASLLDLTTPKALRT